MSCVFAAAGIALLAAPISAEETLIYKSVTEDGSVEFSDQPAPDAVITTPSPVNIVPATVSNEPSIDSEQAGEDAASDELVDTELTSITRVSITSPADQETLIGLKEPVLVIIDTAPATDIPEGLKAEVMLDGTPVMTGASVELLIPALERGAHQIQVRIVDDEGLVVAESALREFHVKQWGAKNSQ